MEFNIYDAFHWCVAVFCFIMPIVFLAASLIWVVVECIKIFKKEKISNFLDNWEICETTIPVGDPKENKMEKYYKIYGNLYNSDQTQNKDGVYFFIGVYPPIKWESKTVMSTAGKIYHLGDMSDNFISMLRLTGQTFEERYRDIITN